MDLSESRAKTRNCLSKEAAQLLTWHKNRPHHFTMSLYHSRIDARRRQNRAAWGRRPNKKYLMIAAQVRPQPLLALSSRRAQNYPP